MISFTKDVVKKRLDPLSYEEFGLGSDIFNWIADWLGSNTQMSKIISHLEEIHQTQLQSYVPLAYSGSGQPLLKALDTLALDGRHYNVNTVIMVGSPSNKSQITNPNLKTIINVYGSQDLFLAGNVLDVDSWQEFLVQALRSDVQLLTQAFTNGTLPTPTIQDSYSNVQTINIELLGIGHADYFVNPDKRASATRTQLNTELFLGQLSAITSGNRTRSLEDFLKDFPRSSNGTIQVDIHNWDPNQ